MQAPSAGSSVDHNLLVGAAESEALFSSINENPCTQNCLIPSNIPASTNPLAYSCDIHLNQPPYTFCTTSLLCHENLGIPPFLLNPHQTYAHDPANSRLFSGGEVTCEFGIWDSEDLFINDDLGKGDFNGSSYAKGSLTSNEQFELGYLSDNLDIASIPASTEQNPRLDEICEVAQVPSTNDPNDEYNLEKLIDGLSYAKGSLTSNEQGYLSDNLDIVNIPATTDENNPRLDEIIYEAPPQVLPSTDPAIYLANDECNIHSKLVQNQEKIHPTLLCPFEVAATVHKPRISWTQELRELFLDAVNKLDGPENATPKSILRLMDVKGLHIDHVKSHLQKYRLTMNVQKLKRDEVGSSSEERPATTGKEGGEYTKRLKGSEERPASSSEAWRLQMGFQKQLHQQLKILKELQLHIEKQGECFKEFLDHEQQISDSSGGMQVVSKSDSERQAKKNSNSEVLRGTRKRVIREEG